VAAREDEVSVSLMIIACDTVNLATKHRVYTRYSHVYCQCD